MSNVYIIFFWFDYMVERGRSKFDSNFKEELKKEIKQELLLELRSKNETLDSKKEKIVLKEGRPRGAIRLLIVLVLIVLILDFSVIFYYNFPFSASGFSIKKDNLTNSEEIVGDCSDGTLENTCSKTKPYYCSNGKLVEAGYSCGCPAGYTRQFQSCIKE